jgi:hypothetical protein
MIKFCCENTRLAFNKVVCAERALKNNKDLRLLQDSAFNNLFAWEGRKDFYRILEIRFCKNDVLADGMPKEFFWVEMFIPVGTYGDFSPNDVFDSTKQTMGMHGILFNHGTSNQPSWSIHT